MKKLLIILLSIILALSSGLLIYGVTLGDAVKLGADFGELLPPENPDEYAEGIAEWVSLYSESENHRTLNVATNPSKNPATFAAEVNGWYDVFGKADPSTSILARYSGADLAAYLIVPVTYNHNRAKQFCMTSHYEIRAEDEISYSDSLRLKKQNRPAYVDYYYRSSAWTGNVISSMSNLRVRYDKQLFRSLSNPVDSYDPETGLYEVKYHKPDIDVTAGQIDREVPFKTYDLLNFPIYLGDGEDEDNDYYAKMDSSVIDSATVEIILPTTDKPYYTLSFSEDLAKAQIKENLQDRLNACFGRQMKNLTLKKADFVFEIWESGLFRQAHVDIDVNAKIGGQQGDAKIKMDYKFYYDDTSCDLIKMIDETGWANKYFNSKTKAAFETAKAKRDQSAA